MHNIVRLLALALTNLANLVSKWPNRAKANLVTNLTKPSLDLDKIWARLDTIIKQATTIYPAVPLHISGCATHQKTFYALTIADLSHVRSSALL